MERERVDATALQMRISRSSARAAAAEQQVCMPVFVCPAFFFMCSGGVGVDVVVIFV